MAYSEITNAEIDTDSPLTQTLMTKLRDNPLFALAGDGFYNGAGWHPVDWTASDQTGDGLIYDNAVDGNVANVTYALEDGWDYLFMLDGIDVGSAFGSFFLLQDSSDGSSFSNVISSTELFGGEIVECFFHLTLPRWAGASMPGLLHYGLVEDDGNLSAGTRFMNADVVHSVRFLPSSGTIDEGKIYAFRRREYASGL